MQESFKSIKEEIEATNEIIQDKALYEAVKRGIEQIKHGDVLDASDVIEDDKASQEAYRWEEIKGIIETWKEATDSWKELANTWEKIADAWEKVANERDKVIDNIVINLFKRGLSIDEISGITGLPVQEIETLVRSSNKPPFYC